MLLRLALLPFVLLAGAAAHAETCAPARLLSSVPLHSAEPQSNIRTVPVSLNGVTRDMILDTGGAVTQLSRSVVAELGLPYGAAAPPSMTSMAAFPVTSPR